MSAIDRARKCGAQRQAAAGWLAPPPPRQQPEMLTAALALAVAHSHVAVRGLDDDSCWATTLLSATSIAGAVALPPPDPLVPSATVAQCRAACCAAEFCVARPGAWTR